MAKQKQHQQNSIKSESLFQRRWREFKGIKRAYYSLIIISVLYSLSFFNPLLVNNKALVVKHDGSYSFPAVADLFNYYMTDISDWSSETLGFRLPIKHYEANQFGQTEVFGETAYGDPHYRQLKKQYKTASNGDWVIMPLYPYSPTESLLAELGERATVGPNRTNILGTDNRGRDVFSRLVYGFQISISFAIIVTFFSYLIGTIMGAFLAYYGGRVDVYGVRLVEVFSSIPSFFVLIMIASFVKPSFWLLSFLVVIFGWIGTLYYIRAEFFREKAKEYVSAAIAMGASDFKVMFKHILPNSLVPIITFAPFAIIGAISSLVSLDYLGFGLRAPTPSWGELISQGREDIRFWWLILTPFVAMFFTLLTITFIGEGVREAFDPRDQSRLR